MEILWLFGCKLADGFIDRIYDLIVDHKVLLGLEEEVETEIGVVLLIHTNLDDLLESKLPTSRNLLETLGEVELDEVVWVGVVVVREEIGQILHDHFLREHEALGRGVGLDVVDEHGEGDAELGDDTTDQDDSVVGSLAISDVVYLHFDVVLLVSGSANDVLENGFLEPADSLLLPLGLSDLLPLVSLLLFLALLFHLLLSGLLSFVLLSDDALFMEQGNTGHRVVENVVHLILVVSVLLHVELYLVVESWDVRGADAEINWLSESSLVYHDLESIFLEKSEEVLGKSSGDDFLVVLS